MRGNFKKADVNELARQSGFQCSNPSCRRPTVGSDGEGRSASIGVAAHITVASVGGPRYDPNISETEIPLINNGIWLCQTCSRLIDVDVTSHSTDFLHEWKKLSEIQAYLALRNLEVVQSRS